MLRSKSKKMTLPLCLCVMSLFLSPALTQAETSTGSTAARQAADQKAALAKKAAAQQKTAEEKQKTTEVQVPVAEAAKVKTEEK